MTHATPYPGTQATQVPVPPPSSLCPQCGCVEVDAHQYKRGAIDEIIYACDRNHGWLVRWIDVA